MVQNYEKIAILQAFNALFFHIFFGLRRKGGCAHGEKKRKPPRTDAITDAGGSVLDLCCYYDYLL